MSKIDEYQRKKMGYENLDNVTPYCPVGVRETGCNMPDYIIKLRTDGRSPECRWFYQAVVENWAAIRESMKKIAERDVNRAMGEAAKEAGDFLGLVGK